MEYILSGYLFWFIIFWFSVIALARFIGILAPNWTTKRYLSGKWKINDGTTRFWNTILLFMWIYIIFELMGWLA